MIEDKDTTVMKELLEAFEHYRTGLGDADGPLEPPKHTMAQLGWILINLEQQAERVVAMAGDARRDTEREEAARQCEATIKQLSKLYSVADDKAEEAHYTDRKPIVDFMRQVLKQMDRVAAQIRELAEHYLAEHSYQG